MQSKKVTTDEVKRIAELARIPISPEETEKLAVGFTTTYEVVDGLNAANTTGMTMTQQVTGLENVMREDVIDEERTFSQAEALRNAKNTHNGFFVVDQVLDKDL